MLEAAEKKITDEDKVDGKEVPKVMAFSPERLGDELYNALTLEEYNEINEVLFQNLITSSREMEKSLLRRGRRTGLALTCTAS